MTSPGSLPRIAAEDVGQRPDLAAFDRLPRHVLIAPLVIGVRAPGKSGADSMNAAAKVEQERITFETFSRAPPSQDRPDRLLTFAIR